MHFYFDLLPNADKTHLHNFQFDKDNIATMSFLSRLLSVTAAEADNNTGNEDEQDNMTGTSDDDTDSEGAAMSKLCSIDH